MTASTVETKPEPKADEPRGADIDKKVDYLRLRMEFNEVDPAALEAFFPGGLDAIRTKADVGKVGNWIEQQKA